LRVSARSVLSAESGGAKGLRKHRLSTIAYAGDIHLFLEASQHQLFARTVFGQNLVLSQVKYSLGMCALQGVRLLLCDIWALVAHGNRFCEGKFVPERQIPLGIKRVESLKIYLYPFTGINMPAVIASGAKQSRG
jgi:hypothetical protein